MPPLPAEPRVRFEIFQQAEELQLEEAPVAPLIHMQRVFLIHPAVKAWKQALLSHNRYKDILLEDQSVPTRSPMRNNDTGTLSPKNNP